MAIATQIRMTRKYLGFERGKIFNLGNKTKVSAYQIKDKGATHWIPKTHCELVGPVPAGVALLSPLPESEPAFGKPGEFNVPNPEPRKSLEDNEAWLSFFTKGVLPTSGVDHVITMYPSDTWDGEYWEFIPDFDPNYVWDPDVLEAVHLGELLTASVLLVGLPGTGKTTAHKQYAAIIGQPFFRVNGKDGMEPSSFVGAISPDGKGGWQWSDGTVPRCMKIGAYLCIDEVMKLPAGINMTMQSVWERGGSLVLDDKPGTLKDKLVHPHENFRLVATDNVRGLGDNFTMAAATQIQDTSTLDRFDITKEVFYMDERLETNLFHMMYPGVLSDVVHKLVQVAGLVREAYKQEQVALTFSPRGLNTACQMITQGLPPTKALHLAYVQKLADETEVETVWKFAKETVGL